MLFRFSVAMLEVDTDHARWPMVDLSRGRISFGIRQVSEDVAWAGGGFERIEIRARPFVDSPTIAYSSCSGACDRASLAVVSGLLPAARSTVACLASTVAAECD